MNRSLLGIVVLGLASVAVVGVAESTGQAPSGGAAPPAAASACHPAAVLDLVRIFDECAQIKDLNDKIRRRTEEIKAEGTRRSEEIENRQQELAAFEPGTPDYETRRKDLLRKNIDASVWFKMMEAEIDGERYRWTRVIYEKAVLAASEIARERGYDVVLQRTDFKAPEVEQDVQTLRRMIQERVVVWNAPEVDITELVVRRLDAAYKALGNATPAAPSARQSP